MRLIDADKIKYGVSLSTDKTINFDSVALKGDIAALPTVDAVPVVRCKDCRYHTDDNYCRFHMVYLAEIDRNEQGYCSEGERKEQ